MPEAKFERDMLIVQQHWNNFISLIKKDLNELYAEKRKIVVTIKRIERIEKILQHSQDNIEFLLLHKESFTNLDTGLEQKFAILEAFKKRDNLGNAVALRTYKEILESIKVKSAIEKINYLKEKRDSLQDLIDKINNLIYGTAYDIETIVQLSQKYNLSAESRTAIIIYPVFKSSKKNVPNNQRKTDNQRNLAPTSQSVSFNIEQSQETLSDGKLEAFDANQTEVEVPNFRDLFEEYKTRYEKIKSSTNLLLNKYYAILSEMKPAESQYYRIYCSLTDEELANTDKAQIKGDYDEAVAKIIAIKIFDIKSEIENYFQTIIASNYSNREDIDFLGEYINEYKVLSDKLSEIDKKITEITKKTQTFKEPKVFFLTDRTMKPLIPDVIIRESVYQGSLMNIIQKAQEGHIQKKKGSNIMPLKINDKEFKDECGRTVFAIRNNKIIVSYIKLNSDSGLSNDGGIIILTASLLNPNTIQEATDAVIKANKDQIIRQIAAIERGNPQQIELQAVIRDEITQKSDQSLESGEISGRKTK